MTVAQIYELMNKITTEQLGESVIVQEDLSNVVDIGTAFENTVGLDNYVKSLVDHIGRVIVVDRVYNGRVPSVLMDGWEFGSIMEKITIEMPKAEENESWELVDGASYDPNIFYKPQVKAKFFNNKVTFEINMSFTEMQVKSAFSSPTQMNAFMSGIYNSIQKKMTFSIDSLIMRTINNFIGETLHNANAGATPRAVNLLALYNAQFPSTGGTPLTAQAAITDPKFIRFAALTMSQYVDRMAVLSSMFNIDGNERFTPKDLLHVVMLSDFKNAANVYLQSDVFHDEYTVLPTAETVPYWQGPGLSYAFADVSKINIKTASNNTVEQSGILAVMFDRDALGVANMNPRVRSHVNEKAEFINEFHKWDAMYFNDTGENFVVFYVA